eukprot:scaffold151769_cov18-Tisochrysis_lutea.AAC.2
MPSCTMMSTACLHPCTQSTRKTGHGQTSSQTSKAKAPDFQGSSVEGHCNRGHASALQCVATKSHNSTTWKAARPAHLQHKHKCLVILVASVATKYDLIQGAPAGGAADAAWRNLHRALSVAW